VGGGFDRTVRAVRVFSLFSWTRENKKKARIMCKEILSIYKSNSILALTTLTEILNVEEYHV
jgi:hypothetical protein